MKNFILFLMFLFLVSANANATVGWSKNIPSTSENPQAISPDVIENNTALDLMLQNYRDGYVTITLSSTSLITIGSGGVMLSNSGGSTRLMVANSSTSSISPTNIDTGSISPSSTYYIYAYASTTTATTFSVIYSASSTSPTGITYYKRLGTFTTDSGSNFVGVNSDVAPPGPFSTQNVVTGSRALSSVYQNTTGKTMFVTVSATGGSGAGTFYAYTDASSSPSTVVVMSNTPGGNQVSSISFMVLSNNYYKVVGGISLDSWTEWS